ncbi:MAG: histidinol-phosphatase [Proteobacteria bacterium]|nr:MAG: histidinol-phosphatase [Pseudomonadota bacterium]
MSPQDTDSNPAGAAPEPELIRFAEDLADAARPVALRYFRNPLEVEHKADASPVTIADRTVESTMREMITARYPHHGILGEEHGGSNLEGAETWVLDPIDGTQSFITGMPTFGTLIALLQHGRPVIGIVDMPALGERWAGASSRATTLNGRPCRTRACRELRQASVYATSVDIFTPEELDALNTVTARAALRRFGGDCYSYALLAAGYVDAVMESSLKPYDYLPLVPIIEGAGGVITDWTGAALHLRSDGRVIAAATPELHAELLSTLPEAFR